MGEKAFCFFEGAVVFVDELRLPQKNIKNYATRP